MNIHVLFSAAFGLLRKTGQLSVCAASLALVCAPPAQADQVEQHDTLASRYINEMHADPLVADCAAHGSFIASTANVFDRVDFPASSFDSAHSSVSPWNAPFDQAGKQRIQVDTVVTVEGVGVARGGSQTDLRFRCGYVGNQMLAFGWNNPATPAAAGRGRASGGRGDESRSSYTYRYRGHGRHRHLVRVERDHRTERTERAGRRHTGRYAHERNKHAASKPVKGAAKGGGKARASSGKAHKTHGVTTKKRKGRR